MMPFNTPYATDAEPGAEQRVGEKGEGDCGLPHLFIMGAMLAQRNAVHVKTRKMLQRREIRVKPDFSNSM